MLEYIKLIEDKESKELCSNFFKENFDLFRTMKGSQYNHQTWKGGYYDHIVGCMSYACKYYKVLSSITNMPFTLSDALTVLFLHDIEKLFPEKISDKKPRPKAKAEARKSILKKYGFSKVINKKILNALTNIETEDSYSNKNRGMSELQAFCHICDITSARIFWYF